MWNQLHQFLKSSSRRWLYLSLSVTIAIAITIVIPQASYGSSWLDLIFKGVQVIQLSSISDSQEVQLGQQINQQLIRQNQIRILNNASLNSYLNQIGQRLAKTSNRPNLPYKFQIINDKQINAFATMGGYVYINRGLMLEADNEAELASVVAHEIGHIVERHSIDQMREAAISQGLLSAAGLDRDTFVNIGVQLAVSLPNSRQDEYEADERGLVNLTKAGYAPGAMVSFMRKLLKQGGSAPTFLSTHPAVGDRVKRLEKAIDPETASVGDGMDVRAYKNRISAAR
ncbi:M48 family metalloprotease [Candidatus Gracilibacteria bacterium]|jgi:beta-barrel assembly-enhancing protease|nr:M48 family metalloprotease [Candidatus Gracilibacteria bacterium]NJM86847.1 M48 family metalloprotease [Hydrococcus sp. RU_2_2]NJP17881.1 M48 family metalloprotease [Hydrococcus sp. CRU_1_1]NJQ98185.1 M48 family metalloprotease [Hydrococcus sp. CSU_1_8]